MKGELMMDTMDMGCYEDDTADQADDLLNQIIGEVGLGMAMSESVGLGCVA